MALSQIGFTCPYILRKYSHKIKKDTLKAIQGHFICPNVLGLANLVAFDHIFLPYIMSNAEWTWWVHTFINSESVEY